MDHFQYKDNHYFAEEVNLTQVAERFGTPCYVYSRATLERHWHAFNHAFGAHPHLICYAVKANSNLAILNLLARLGSGFDIVSQGELERVVAAGGCPSKTVFSGVGKTSTEIIRALELKVKCFNIESEAELERIQAIAAQRDVQAPISIRVNPDVDAQTHPYKSTGHKEKKVGIDIDAALALYKKAAAYSHIDVTGIDCHIGSQLTSLAPFLDALDRVLNMIDQLEQIGITLKHIDMGGGLGVTYDEERPPLPDEYAKALVQKLSKRTLEIIVEPGRAIAANAGILLTKVEYLKPTADKNFAIVDAAMNDLLRPSLYQSWQEVVPVVKEDNTAVGGQSKRTEALYDIVGPICETGDFLAKERPLTLAQNDLLAIRSAGAYGFTMSSNYNSRNRAAEVMVDGDKSFLIRARECYTDQFKQEYLLP